MKTFKRKLFHTAVLAALGTIGAVETASAVNVNNNGLGQVLLYPSYTSRNGFDTYISVVNTTASVKAVKVRFLEGKNSREVLDFNLYLSPQDVWTGAVVNTAAGAKLVTADKSCTTPMIPAAGVDFRNQLFSGAVVEGFTVPAGGASDGSTQSLDRTREGYFEIIEMGVVTSTKYAAAVTHTAAGVPANCALLQSAAVSMASGATEGGIPVGVIPPAGGLAGRASLVNVANGTDFGYDATALAAFSDVALWTPPDNILPSLQNTNPRTSVVFKNGAAITTTAWPFGEDAVSAVLMHNSLSNEYTVETGLTAATDWVVTMPTKRFYVPVDQPNVIVPPAVSGFIPAPPFTKTYWDGACEPVVIAFWDREEQAVTSGLQFSPAPVNATQSLCWESTIVSFAPASSATASTVLGSTNFVGLPVTFQNGWARLTFATQSLTSAPGQVAPAGVHTYAGLPTIGFMAESFKNNAAQPGVLATYGGNFNHKTTTVINGVAGD